MTVTTVTATAVLSTWEALTVEFKALRVLTITSLAAFLWGHGWGWWHASFTLGDEWRVYIPIHSSLLSLRSVLVRSLTHLISTSTWSGWRLVDHLTEGGVAILDPRCLLFMSIVCIRMILTYTLLFLYIPTSVSLTQLSSTSPTILPTLTLSSKPTLWIRQFYILTGCALEICH